MFFANRNSLIGRLLTWALCALVLAPAGCTRRFFRNRSDREVEGILKQKDQYEAWKIEQFHVYPDPRARFADPTNPDRPPKPPDDPAAYNLSPNPQKGKIVGIKYVEGDNYLDLMAKWDAENRERKAEEAAKQPPRDTSHVEKLPGEDRTPAEIARDIDALIEAELARGLAAPAVPGQAPPLHPFLLGLGQIVELGFFNSREFQTVRENLYLAALPVTTERFSFAAQPFMFGNAIRQRSGSANSTPGNGWAFNTAAGVTKLFPTGALLLFNLANQTVYNLGNGLTTTSVSTVSLDLVQPMLAGGGWAVALEPLTQAERNLLYGIRDYMRLRQEYFVFFAAGQPTFIPGVQPGVPAISPTTTTQFSPFIPLAAPLALVSNPADPPQVVPGAGGRLLPVNGFGPTPQGYLSTVGERGNLVNAYKNITNLQRFLRLFRVYEEGGIVNRVQVGQIEQQLLRSTEGVLNNQVTYRISLDQLKQQLGLPMSVVIDLDDAPLRPMIDLTQRFENVTRDFEDATSISLSYGRIAEAENLRKRLRNLFQHANVAQDTRFHENFPRVWGEWEKLPDGAAGKPGPFERRLDALRAERQRLRQQPQPAADPLANPDIVRLDALDLEIETARFERALRVYERQPWKRIANPLDQVAQQNTLFRLVHRSFLNLLEQPFSERLDRIRKSWPDLPPVCVQGVDVMRAPEEQALEVVQRAALQNRLDLMNVRGQLVDSWRKIRVVANSLLGAFNIDYHMDASSLGNARPFNLGGSTTRHQLIFNWQLPLVRILQRNNYRSALIAYQQMRRSLMSQEDTVVFNVRLELRTLRATAQVYEQVQHRQIELAYLQVDQALQAFSQPQAPPGADVVLPGLVGPTASRPQVGDPAALTTQLLSTQNSLLNAQNDLYSVWLGFLTTRMNFFRDLGIMPLDSRGVWIDDVARCECTIAPDNHGAERAPVSPELPAPNAFPPAEGAPMEPRR